MWTYSGDLRGDVGCISTALACQSQFDLDANKLEAVGAVGRLSVLVVPSLEASGVVSVAAGVGVEFEEGGVSGDARLGVASG
jgi:hypothetical protein